MDVKENEYINLLFVEPPIENMCFTLGVRCARALIVLFSFAWFVCLFVYRLDFLFFGCCACVAFFMLFFLIIMSNALTKMLIFMNITWCCFHFHVFVSIFDWMLLKYATISISHRRCTCFFFLLQSDEHHLCVIYIQMYSNTRVIFRSFPPSFNSLSRVLTFLRVLCHHSLELHHSSCCLCLFYLRFFSESVWISEWIYFDTIFLHLVEILNTNLFAHFFFLPCVVFFLITTSYKTSSQSCRKNAAHAQFITRWCVYWSICNSLYFVYVFLQRI